MAMTKTLDSLRQHELVILRRLRASPLTEFELAHEIAEHSGHSSHDAAENVAGWLEELKEQGYVWTGQLFNLEGQKIYAAALTRLGREIVGG